MRSSANKNWGLSPISRAKKKLGTVPNSLCHCEERSDMAISYKEIKSYLLYGIATQTGNDTLLNLLRFTDNNSRLKFPRFFLNDIRRL